jgi:hypothetical protein
MSQEEVVTKILEEIKKINEVLKDEKISELCRELRARAGALEAINKKYPSTFTLRFVRGGDVYYADIYVDNVKIAYLQCNSNTTLDKMFEELFSSEEIRASLLHEIHNTLAELAKLVAEKADAYERLKKIEEELGELEEDP